MSSNNGNGRGDGPKRRPGDPRRRRSAGPGMESLEERRLLDAGGVWHPTSGNLADAQNGPMANLGGDLVQVYQDYLKYEQGGGVGTFTTAESKRIEVVGTTVGIDIRGSGNLQTFEQAMVGLGMKVSATAPKESLVEGFLPISALPAAAKDPQTFGGLAVYKPELSYVGNANNEAETALGAGVARTTYNVDGTGVKIGIISDSVDQYPTAGTGLAESISTGNLPNNVQVLSDGIANTPGQPPVSTDEGRAMLENVHDVAPGASLAFASGELGEATFAQSIRDLANIAGANLIADDLGFPTEPFFQEGIASQAVDTVTSQGVLYFSAVGNAADSGYQSAFHGINTTVNGVGAGRFMNFDPSGATQSPLLGVNVYSAGTGVIFQWDQSFYAQTRGSDIQIYVLNAAGAIVTQGTNNPNAVGEPIQITGNLPIGQYFVAIQVKSGADPNHIVFQGTNDGGFNVDHKFTLNGANPTSGITYPNTAGHASAANTISVGAVPWWGAAPYNTTGTPNNEPFSSFGPVLQTLDVNGNPIAPVTLLKPDISAPDGGNTSFFPPPPNNVIDTSKPPFPVQPPYPNEPSTVFPEPATATNLSQNLPSFFGTSAAVENLAGVVALMKQSVPTLTKSEILNDLFTTAIPLNGQAKGVWNPQAGYGLASATAALAAAQVLRVASITPGGGQTITSAPTSILVQFTQPVNLSTVKSSNLTVTGPNGAIVTVGQPIGVDSATFPTLVRFPITITPRPGVIANGVYTDTFVPGSIVSQAGQPLVGTVVDKFTIQETQGPRIAKTTYVGRIVTITFDEAANPATVTPANIYLSRSGGIKVSQLPGATFSYNQSTLTVTIDLTNVAQSSLPTDDYKLTVTTGVTSVVGNPLNGAFNGVFPSGTNPAAATGSAFVQDLGLVQVPAPIVTYLVLNPATDSGIKGDSNTNVNQNTSVVGQITAKFPGALAGVLVYAEFNGIAHPGVPTGGLDLAVGANGRGFVGHFDVQTVTNSLGQFTINLPAGVTLPDGLNRVRVVVIGQPDQPPFPGMSSAQDSSFRIDTTLPYVGSPATGIPATSIPQNANVNSLSTLTLNVVDPVNPTTIGSPFAVDPRVAFPALNPTVANNVQNYKLLLVNGNTTVDESSFIASAAFTSTSARSQSSAPYTGQIVLTFNPGLPTGTYKFLALSSAYGTGLSDAAGNAFGGYPNPTPNSSKNFQLQFNLQPTPTYITSYYAYTPDASVPGGFSATGARASYELPVPGVTPRATAPPTSFHIDFSNSLNSSANYSSLVQLVRSADPGSSVADGNFGTLGITNGNSGYTTIAGTTVTLGNSVPGAVFGQYGYNNRLTIRLPAGLTLPADYYRLYIPNSGQAAIRDVYGNQLDGEFLGYQNASGKYVDDLQTGVSRGSGATELPDLSGDGTPGGAFMTGFVVVPNGNIIYANAAAIYNPQIPSQTPDGSAARPFPVLAPEAVPTAANGGDLNSPVNSGTNFNATYDRSGDGQFEPSALFAAQQRVELNGGPVVVIAQQSVPSRDPITGLIIQKPFVLQAPSPSGNQVATIANDASTAIPALTTLDLQSGVILKMQNAALLVQNQGSALQITGGPNSYQGVNITSYKDSSVGGVSNGNPNSTPASGDYGGIVFRNFSQAALPGENAPRSNLFPGQIPTTGIISSDNRLKGPFATLGDPTSQVDAVSGADDVMSSISFLTEKYAGGVVPVTIGTAYDGITLLNSRPAIVNSTIAFAGVGGAAQAGLSVDVDSLRADDNAQGPLIRNDQFLNNGLNGIYIRAQVSSGLAEPTNAVYYPVNPTTGGGSHNYVLDDPYPYLLTSRLLLGSALNVVDNSQLAPNDRLYVDPGMILKFEHAASLLIEANASLNVGDQTYIKEYDANHLVGPTFAANDPSGTAGQVNPNFKANSALLSQVIFTSLNDDTATTTYFDPIAQVTRTVVQALPAIPGGSGALQPTPTNVPDPARWGGVTIASGAVGVINSANLRYGGGAINTPAGSATQHVLELQGGNNNFFLGTGTGSHVSITNNLFDYNLDVPINANPNALLAADPTRPLNSGDPFIHGNVFQGNGLNGVGVDAAPLGINVPNLFVNSVWTGSDFTYILRNTVVLSGYNPFAPPLAPSTPAPELQPAITLTLQSTLAGTILADGTTVAAPGVPLIIKELNTTAPPTETPGAVPAPAVANSYVGGAGFIVGVDNGVDPTTDSLVDNGLFSQIRILGIGANQTTGQTRVPVIITSIHDSSVGTTVNSVKMNQVIPNDAAGPKAGDGGVIYFGGNSLTDYSLQDTRDGSLIDNADIKYITRIEQQGGGLIYGFGQGTTALVADYNTKLGLPLPVEGYADQYNSSRNLTISNSNLSTFSDVALRAHPGYGSIVYAVDYPSMPLPTTRQGGIPGEATHTYLVNNTITGMPQDRVAVELISDTGVDIQRPGVLVSSTEAVFLNNTFDNNGTAIHSYGPPIDGINFAASVAFLAMDNIFSNNTVAAVTTDGRHYGSDLQYNLFYQNGADSNGTNPTSNSQPVAGNPAYRDPGTGNYFLLPTSAAIDVARSELGPSIFGDMLYPSVTIDPFNLGAIPIRNTLGNNNDIGGSPNNNIPFLGGSYNADPLYVVTLPGEPYPGSSAGPYERPFPDQWIPVLVSSGLGTGGTASNAATYDYQPILGERDQAGNKRQIYTKSGHTGFGSRPFFDLGAFEYIVQNPPVVDAVTAKTSSGTTSIYSVGGIAGTNQLPSSIQFLFSQRLDPSTISGMSVLFQASGGDGIFGNGNSPLDRTINLSGKLAFDPTTDILTIDTSGIFTSTATANDEYRIILKGTGSAVIRNTDGLALDGLNLDANGNQTALPSGADQFPGSDFQLTFTIDTNPPSIVNGTFVLDPASDTSGGRHITKINLPTFDGTITDIFPPTNPLLGQSVHIDISSQGNGVFDILDAGIGTTDASGNFRVTLTKPIPDTPNTIGAGGIKGAAGATYAQARVRVIDQAGNVSSQTAGTVTTLEVDTKDPTITAVNPAGGTVAVVNANRQVTFSVTFSQNIKDSSINPNSLIAQRTGGTGSFANPVNVTIVPGSVGATYAANGFETITFTLAAPLTNDQYRIVLRGTGPSPITDIAGNPLDGQGIGSASDYNGGSFVVYSPSGSHLIYVQAPGTFLGTGTLGTRNNPFTTIAAGMNAALLGDDVLVLPGTYRESVALKPGVRLLSAALTSTDTLFQAGSPYQTLIYGTPSATATGNIITVSVSGSVPGIPTEVSGLGIISPLLGDVNFGPINPTSVGIQALNSDIKVDRNLIFDAGLGVSLGTTGANAPASQVFDNVIAGNIYGIGISDNGRTSSMTGPFLIVNNTIADNTTGLYNVTSSSNAIQAFVLNNIFYSNHSLSSTRTGTGILSLSQNTLGVGSNDFYQNGVNTAAASNASGLFGQFVPSNLSSTPDALHNILANPFFAQAEDPRPNGDGPAVFLNYSNFDLTSRSLAINAGNNSVAPTSDFLYRTPVAIPGHGFSGTGPASIGAFYFGGKTGPSGGTGIPFPGTTGTTGTTGSVGGTGVKPGGITNNGGVTNGVTVATVTNSSIGGGIALGTRQFNVVTTSLSDGGTLHAGDSTGGVATEAGPAYIDVNFTNDIKASTLSPTDLVLSGSGLNAANPAKATSLAWIDDHAVRFFLSGSYNNSGTVNVSIPQGAITDTNGAAVVGFGDSIQLASTVLPAGAAVVPTATSTPTVAPAVALPVQPVAAAAPVAAPAPAHHLTPKQLKQQAAAAKAEKAAEAKAAKHAAQVKAAQAKAAAAKAAAAKAAKAAKAAHHAKKSK